MTKTDIIIIGGGLTGLTLATALGSVGVAVVLVDREPPEAMLDAGFDGRTTAIAAASQRILAGLGLWDGLAGQAAPIREIRTADQQSPRFLHFDVGEVEGEAFGWIVENRLWRSALFEALEAMPGVRLIAPARADSFAYHGARIAVTLSTGEALCAGLIVGADGRGSPTRAFAGIDVFKRSYPAHALVCVARHAAPHGDIAVEHFQANGPFAVLPMIDDEQGRHRSSIVWTETPARAEQFAALPKREFDSLLQQRFGTRLGKVTRAGNVWRYPLGLQLARQMHAERIALIGEAAHVVHPIAGQGLNLSMRDVAMLAERIVDQLRLGLDPGDPALLARYDQARRADILAMAAFTDGIDRLFSNDIPPVQTVRDLGLSLVERIGPLKRYFMRHAMGTTLASGRLMQGLPL